MLLLLAGIRTQHLRSSAEGGSGAVDAGAGGRGVGGGGRGAREIEGIGATRPQHGRTRPAVAHTALAGKPPVAPTKKGTTAGCDPALRRHKQRYGGGSTTRPRCQMTGDPPGHPYAGEVPVAYGRRAEAFLAYKRRKGGASPAPTRDERARQGAPYITGGQVYLASGGPPVAQGVGIGGTGSRPTHYMPRGLKPTLHRGIGGTPYVLRGRHTSARARLPSLRQIALGRPAM